jgi:hypothetical protein
LPLDWVCGGRVEPTRITPRVVASTHHFLISLIALALRFREIFNVRPLGVAIIIIIVVVVRIGVANLAPPRVLRPFAQIGESLVA